MKVILFFISVLILNSFARAEQVTLVSDLWCPYVCEPNTEKPGFMVEIAKNIFEASGHKFEFKIINWARAITDTRSGKYSGILAAARGDAPDFIFPKMEEGKSTNYFWAIKNSTWSYKNLGDLKGKKIGVINNYSYGEDVDVAIKTHNPAYVVISGEDALIKMMKMTASNRLDAFVENPNVLEYQMQKMAEFKDAFKRVSKNITNDSDLFIAFPTNNPKAHEYAELMSNGMKKLRSTGKLKTILNKYGLKDWQ